MITVTAAVLVHEGKVLIARRKSRLAHGDFWEFPGGKINADETPRQCLQRELKEELDIEVRVEEHLGTGTHDDGEQRIRLLIYRVAWIAGTMRLRDHTEVRWVAPWQLDDFEFTPADRWFVDKLKQSGIPR